MIDDSPISLLKYFGSFIKLERTTADADSTGRAGGMEEEAHRLTCHKPCLSEWDSHLKRERERKVISTVKLITIRSETVQLQ